MVVKPGKRKDFYGVCAKICGVPLGTLHRGGNGQYSLVFQRCDASLEEIEGIDWSRPVVTEAADRYRACPLPEGYGFEVEGIDYSYSLETWTVHLRTAKQFLGDVAGYQAQVEELEGRVSEREKTIQEQAEAIRELESRPDSGAELETALEKAYMEGVESNG